MNARQRSLTRKRSFSTTLRLSGAIPATEQMTLGGGCIVTLTINVNLPRQPSGGDSHRTQLRPHAASHRRGAVPPVPI
jgi:hypothetical protein